MNDTTELTERLTKDKFVPKNETVNCRLGGVYYYKKISDLEMIIWSDLGFTVTLTNGPMDSVYVSDRKIDTVDRLDEFYLFVNQWVCPICLHE